MKRRILFVDDELKVLEGLRRVLYPYRAKWDMEFVNSGSEALNILAGAPFDVIVSDLRMPGMEGGQLLSEVMKRHPQVVRIILSGQADEETVMRTVSTVHQYLAKPCDPEVLKTTLDRAFKLRETLTDETLKALISRIGSLPSVPALYTRLIEELQSPDASLGKVGEIISLDIGMTAKVLQLVNSAFFGIRRQISTPSEAATYLGLNTLKGLTLSLQVFSQFQKSSLSQFMIETLFEHSLATSSLAQKISKSVNAPNKVTDYAQMAGLLHDIGKLVLAANLPQQYDKALTLAAENKVPHWEAERDVFGSTHAEVGGYLLNLWGLPHPIVEAILFHHSPSQSSVQGFSPLAAVHAADALVHEVYCTVTGTVAAGVDVEFLGKMGLDEKLSAWRDLCSKPGQGEHSVA